ncbi:MAG TPA: ATP-binding protein [Thermoanaerobaculia bacterium]|nr:ATP-binding protein [Thermoanaerobaculia bacterium]
MALPRSRLRTKLLLYLIVLHLAMGGLGAWILIDDSDWLFAVEAIFVLSLFIGVVLVRALFQPVDNIAETGAELIAERDFTTKFLEHGQPDIDRLVDVYNQMIDRLREERLASQETEQLLEKIVGASPAGIVLCDFDGKVQRMNPAAERILSGAPLPEIAVGESKLVPHQGSRRVRVRRAEFRDRGFAKSFYVVEELTEELRLSEKAAYEKLIRMMSHEVNNSVGAVRSLLESMLAYAPQVREADREDFTNALQIASARVDSLNRFMAAFADVVRIPMPTRGLTPVAPLVERVGMLLRPELTDRKVRLELDLADRGSYDVDPYQIEQVIINVFRNALDAIQRDGTIRAAMIDGVLTIRDSGPGIPEAARSEIFTPFFTTKREGRGLGLTIVQEILANHGLVFSLENAPGGGAVFSIELAGAS